LVQINRHLFSVSANAWQEETGRSGSYLNFLTIGPELQGGSDASLIVFAQVGAVRQVVKARPVREHPFHGVRGDGILTGPPSRRSGVRR
jgi:hypothetical protein